MQKVQDSKFKIQGHSRAFTLVEIIVALAVFSVVMLVSSGALLSVLDGNRKAQAVQSVINNMQFALESMSRAIRVGTTYHCGGGPPQVPRDCGGGSSRMAFEATGGNPTNPGDQVVYRLSNNQIQRSTQGGQSGTFVGVTAPEVVIENLQFYVSGAASTDTLQPRVLIVVQGYAGEQGETRTDFNLQTTISQRTVDF